MKYKRVLSIAGSDSGGGAGIQADIKSISACGGYAMTAVTAVTAQNTLGVQAIHAVPVNIIETQIRSVLDDIGVDAVKIGMLHSSEVIQCIASLLKEYQVQNIVVDPVMVATSGDKLLQDEAIFTLQQELFPLATVITPNLYEAEIITGHKIADQNDVYKSVREMKSTHARSALLKAGHLPVNHFEDVFYDFIENKEYRYPTPKIDTPNTNGTGCSFSSAIAAFLARGFKLSVAVEQAHRYLHGAIKEAVKYKVGKGHGPVQHFYQWWSPDDKQ